MTSKNFGLPTLALLLMVTAIWASACSLNTQGAATPLVLGLDHIPIAVSDLDQAAGQYRKLGFTLKPGVHHENGIRNQHIKFSDGTEIEHITVNEARDPLTAEYLRRLAMGEGAVFTGFYTPDLDQLAGQFDAQGRSYQYDGRLLTFPESDKLRYIFFGQRSRSPTDQPEHFEHRNGAEALTGVWMVTSKDVTIDEIEAFAAGDPAVQSGLLLFEIRPWDMVEDERFHRSDRSVSV